MIVAAITKLEHEAKIYKLRAFVGIGGGGLFRIACTSIDLPKLWRYEGAYSALARILDERKSATDIQRIDSGEKPNNLFLFDEMELPKMRPYRHLWKIRFVFQK